MRRTAALAVVILIVASSLGEPAVATIPTATVDTATPGIHLVGRIATHCSVADSVPVPEGVDADLGVLVLLLPCSRRLTLFSTRTGRELASVDVGTAQGFSLLPIDPVRHLVFLIGSGSVASPSSSQVYTSTIQIYSLTALLAGRTVLVGSIGVPADAVLLAASTADPGGRSTPAAGTGAAGDASLEPSGAAIDAKTGFLYLTLYENLGNTDSATSSRGPGNQDVYVAAIDVAKRVVRSSMFLSECASPAIGNGTEPVTVAGTGAAKVLAVGCLTAKASPIPGSSGGGQAGGGVAGTGASVTGFGSMLSYSIPLDRTGDLVADGTRFVLGRTNALYGVGDPDSGRIFWVTAPPFESGVASDAGPAAVAFDPLNLAYVAAPTVGDARVSNGVGLAVAAAGGRLYAVSRGGVTVADATANGGQGTVFPGFSCFAHALAVDGHLRRLFVLPASSCTSNESSANGPPYVFVFQDAVGQVSASPPPDPDSYTQQIGPNAGPTLATFNGHAEATGARVRVVGALSGVLRGVTFGASHPVEEALQQHGKQVDGDTYDLELSAVQFADLDNFHAGAAAAAALADKASAKQLTDAGAQWPFDTNHQAACSAPGKATGTTTFTDDTYARVSCSSGAQGTTATASAGAVGMALVAARKDSSASVVPSSFRVGRSESSTHVYQDRHGAMTTETASVVHGIEIGPVTIDTVAAHLTCHAHGSRGTASCDYVRNVLGVSVVGGSDVPAGCTDRVLKGRVDNGCSALLDVLNSLYPPYLAFAMPLPDRRAGYIAGSPGGYQAVGQRALFEHLQDSLVSYDGSLEVPGFEVLYVNDSAQSPSRLDVQLADVEAESRYGVKTVASCSMGCGKGPVSHLPGPLPHVPSDSATDSPTPPMAAPTLAPGADGGRVLTRVLDGLRWLMRNPEDIALIAITLALLYSPLGLAARRRRLFFLSNANLAASE